MEVIVFYIARPFIWLFSRLPLRFLYFISDYVLYPLLYKILKYRLKVVRTNLTNSFPEKSEAEKLEIEKKFYHYLADLFVETLKSFSISNKELLSRINYLNEEVLETYLKKHGKIILSLGHIGNYEWLALHFPFYKKTPLTIPYRRLNNPYFDVFFKKSRERNGALLFHTYHTNESLKLYNKKLEEFGLAIVNDQSAPPDRAFWSKFLNQDTAFYVGVEKIAREYNFPVIYVNIQVKSRGHYDLVFNLITENPQDEPVGFILKEHIKNVEKNILQAPQYWLWSHKRWKYEKPEVNASGFGKDSGFFN